MLFLDFFSTKWFCYFGFFWKNLTEIWVFTKKSAVLVFGFLLWMMLSEWKTHFWGNNLIMYNFRLKFSIFDHCVVWSYQEIRNLHLILKFAVRQLGRCRVLYLHKYICSFYSLYDWLFKHCLQSNESYVPSYYLILMK